MIHITYFVHGTTPDNENNIASGWSDVELSELGVKQSYDLRESIKDKSFDEIFSSDLIRARHTAEIAFPGFRIETDSHLRECDYGTYSGISSSEVEKIQEKFIEEPFPQGESYRDVERRIREFIEALRKKYDTKRVAIVSHKGPQLALDVITKGVSWHDAFSHDWRLTKSWKPGWEYVIE